MKVGRNIDTGHRTRHLVGGGSSISIRPNKQCCGFILLTRNCILSGPRKIIPADSDPRIIILDRIPVRCLFSNPDSNLAEGFK